MLLHRLQCTILLFAGLVWFPWPTVAQTMVPKPMLQSAPDPGPVPAEVTLHARDAIIRGLAYFGSPELPLDPDAVLIHAYLKDRFGLPELCSAKHVLAEIRRDTAGTLHKFLRLAEAVPFKPDFLKLQGKSFDNITVAGMWYDKLPKPTVLEDRIEASPLDEQYMATHSLWAMAMARQCFQAEVDTVLEHQLVEKVMSLMERTDLRWDDEAIEALAISQYHDPYYVPSYKYIQELVDLQNPNGSWSWNPGQEVMGSQHTTVLALWALLQYKPLAWPTQPRSLVLH